MNEKDEKTKQECLFTDYRHCLFKIVPKMSYEAHKNYREQVLNSREKVDKEKKKNLLD